MYKAHQHKSNKPSLQGLRRKPTPCPLLRAKHSWFRKEKAPLGSTAASANIDDKELQSEVLPEVTAMVIHGLFGNAEAKG